MFDDVNITLTVLLFVWCFGLGAIEIEIEGGYGWAERLPTWYLKRGKTGKVYGWVMGHRPLTGYHVYAFTIPLVILHLPFGMGVEWSLAAELATIAKYFLLAVIWDYCWFVLNPAYTVKRFKRGNVWWFEVPWVWRFPLDYYVGVLVSIGLVALASWEAGSGAVLFEHLWLIAGLFVLTGLTVLCAPLYHRWYRHMRRAGADDRNITPKYGPPAPEEVWSGGVPDLSPLEGGYPGSASRSRGSEMRPDQPPSGSKPEPESH